MLYLFNTTIVPNEGTFKNTKVSTEEAIEIFKKKSTFTSALGHQGSADAFNTVFQPEEPIQVNRIQAQLDLYDSALCLKVIGRLAEGQILTLEALNQVGFEFYLITRIA